MNSKAKLLLLLLSAALNAAFVGSWVAHSLRASETHRVGSSATEAGATMPALYRQAGLTDEQWQKPRPDLDTFRASALAVFERITQRRQELLALLAAPQANRASIAEKQTEIRAAQAQMQDLVISHVLARKELLLPAQRQKYFELLAQLSGMLCENLM